MEIPKGEQPPKQPSQPSGFRTWIGLVTGRDKKPPTRNQIIEGKKWLAEKYAEEEKKRIREELKRQRRKRSGKK